MAIIRIRPDVPFSLQVFKNDTPLLSFQVFDIDNTAIDVTTVVIPSFTIKRGDNVIILDKAGVLVAGTTGRFDFQLVTSDLNVTPDTYDCEVSATLSGSNVRTFGKGKITVRDEIKT